MSTLVSHIQEFVNYLRVEKRYSSNTWSAYESDLIQMKDYLETSYGELQVFNVSSPMLRSWIADLKQHKQSTRSINRKISSLRSFFKYLQRQEIISDAPLQNLPNPKIEKRLPQYVSEKEMQHLMEHLEFENNFEGLSHYFILQLFYHTGMRVSEMTALTESSLDVGNHQLHIFGKGSKERIAPIHPKLKTKFAEYLQERNKIMAQGEAKNEHLLVDSHGKSLTRQKIYLIVKKYLSRVTTINKKSPHILRHTYATHLLQNGAGISAIKDLLGHSSLASTQVYAHTSIQQLKDVYKKNHPRSKPS